MFIPKTSNPMHWTLCGIIIIAGVVICHGHTYGEINMDEWRNKLKAVNWDMANIIRRSQREIALQQMSQNTISSSGMVMVDMGTTSYGQHLDGLSSPEAQKDDSVGRLILKISANLVHSKCKVQGIPSRVCAKFIESLHLPSTSEPWAQCVAVNDAQRRTRVGKPYRRLLDADYRDGLYKKRSDDHHKTLPLPRNISSQFFEAAMQRLTDANQIKGTQDKAAISREGRLDSERNVLFTQWTQFVEQNLAKTVPQTFDNGQPIQCCNSNFNVIAPRYRHKACAPIEVPENDPFYNALFVNCLNYVRSAITVNPNCQLGVANQINMASNLMDLSQLYGHSSAEMRSKVGGQLKTIDGQFLTKTNDQCFTSDELCLRSGDLRVNANPYMILQHTIFMRSHNNIAKKLQAMNPNWTDDELFLVAKQINLAIYQKITYEEWLPLVVGNSSIGTGLPLTADGVSNEFATVAIRFYNSMMPGDLLDQQRPERKLFELGETFYQPLRISHDPNILNAIMDSVLKQRAMAMDSSYVDDLNMELFKARNGPVGKSFGTDSLALDIMRSRDHGLPGYVYYLNKCVKQNAPATTWSDLEGVIQPQDHSLLRRIYQKVESIDLIMGALAEIPHGGGVVGPTMACIIAEQMENSRRIDKAFYTKDGRLRRTVQNYSGARLICDTMAETSVQANIFQIPSTMGQNPIVCSDESSGGLILEPWLDKKAIANDGEAS